MTGALATVTKSESVKAACQGANPWPELASSGDRHRTHGDTYVFYVILNGVQHSVYFTEEEAMENAAQLDFIYNSPELNDGVQGTNDIQLLTLPEMMMSDVEMVI